MGFKKGYSFDEDPRGKDPIFSWMNNRVEGLHFKDGTTASSIGAAAHDFNADASPGILVIDGATKIYSEGLTDFDISNSGSAVPTGLDVDDAIVYTIVAYKGIGQDIALRVFAGNPALAAEAVALTDDEIGARFDKQVTAFALTEVKVTRTATDALTIEFDDAVRPLHTYVRE